MKYILILAFTAVVIIVNAFCWTYGINEWLVFFDKPARLALWQGALISLVPAVGQAGIVFAVVTWLLMLFVV